MLLREYWERACDNYDARASDFECGHTGFLKCRENDQPYSECWESYSLEGFEGGTANFEPYCKDMKELLASLKPKCLRCGQTGRVRFP
jgi:hypothetical protein